MDLLADLLDGVHARGALFRQTMMDPPWSLRFSVVGAELTLATMVQGRAWVVSDSMPPAEIGPGDVALVKGPYTVADDPGTRPQYLVTRDDYCTQIDGGDLGDCYTAGDGEAVLLSGGYAGSFSQRLLDALPAVIVVQAAGSVLGLVTEEMSKDDPGQQVVVDRLLDLLLVSALRSWFDRPDAGTPAWYRTSDDPIVADALRLIHQRPAEPWTVSGLAAKIGTSRAALSRRFTAQVGEPPITYLTGWRIAIAADLLRDTEDTIGSIARKVGYANAFALSVAFKRLRGITPVDFRTPRGMSKPGVRFVSPAD